MRPNFKFFFVKKILTGPVNSTRDPLKIVQLRNVQNTLPKCALNLNKSQSYFYEQD